MINPLTLQELLTPGATSAVNTIIGLGPKAKDLLFTAIMDDQIQRNRDGLDESIIPWVRFQYCGDCIHDVVCGKKASLNNLRNTEVKGVSLNWWCRDYRGCVSEAE